MCISSKTNKIDFEEKLQKLYEKIPCSTCSPERNCTCCHDVIQFTPTEEERMGGYSNNGVCVHLKDGKCTIYENRPFVCRLYGTSELLRCDGCTAESYLTEDETNALVHEYVEIMKQEESLKLRKGGKKV